ncbi:MAG: ATP-binding cassette domain-containing protein, partial [Crenarchaeota archaeon]|nr:ATP-binding cassette domain-containing protein [Thermoproteota archaeon]
MSYYRIELGEEILRVNDLHVWFPVRRGILDVITGKAKLFVRAVDGVSFNLREREIFCLVGESGCGKTTTGKALMKLVPITKGTAHFKPREETLEKLHKLGVTETDGGWVEILSLPEKKYKPIRRDIQMIYQDPYGSLNPRFRVKDILEEPLLVHGIGESKEERLELIAKTLERVKLIPASDFIDRFP